jgi:hypothetical protein
MRFRTHLAIWWERDQPFRRRSVENPPLRNESMSQGAEIVECLQNRTLEVRGSIPLGSTRKTQVSQQCEAFVVFGLRRSVPQL